ncbi:MAG TPA: amidohydrolase [Ignavibacteriaceae bacterium]|nr:amidohydrolase [Ignavibacteriaceae bacterium]
MRKAYINGKVFTSNSKQPFCESIVTDYNKIVFTGSNEEAKQYIGKNTKVIDLEQNLVLPGLIDCHAHIIMGGFYLKSVDLQPAKTVDEFKSILKKHVSKNRGKWITGGNWNQQNWDIKSLPSKEWIDEFSTDTPVFLSRMDYHMALANSAALKLAGITKDTPAPDGGWIEKDPVTGEPTGIVKDKAMNLVQAVIPEATESEKEDAAITALNEAAKYGVTSIHDIAYSDDFRILQKLDREGKLTSRVFTRLPIERCDEIIQSQIEFGFGNDKLKTGSLKAFADGSLGSATALFFEPYSDEPGNFGLGMDLLNDGRLKQWAVNADKNKLQLSIHAIGDKANSIILDIFEEIIGINPVWDRRFRIEHAQHLKESDIERFKKLNVIASVQPYHLFDDGVWAESKIGKQRMEKTFAFKSLIDLGVTVCFGSDFPVVTINPFAGIYSAVTRQTADNKNPGGLIPDEKLTVEEAIKGYTINAAYSSYEEKIKGSIEPGKLADFVLLSQDILSIPEEEIIKTEVLMTIVNGDTVYSS